MCVCVCVCVCIKQTEDALRESEEKYRNMVETTNEGILMADQGE